jgi:hypothetical protein
MRYVDVARASAHHRGGVEEQGENIVIEGAKNAFGFSVLL